MVSVAVVGPAMSGKTHLCTMLAGLNCLPNSCYNETCSTSFLKADVNGVPWHIWDTPRYVSVGWPADHVAEQCDVIVVCHDGAKDSNPCALARELDTDKCIIALTRNPYAGINLAWAWDYYSTTTSAGALVPVVASAEDAYSLIHCIQSRCAPTVDSENVVEL